jgi:flavin reductase (DIM6/NTAB) family NADH-FMN oxidoreductase RutF
MPKQRPKQRPKPRPAQSSRGTPQAPSRAPSRRPFAQAENRERRESRAYDEDTAPPSPAEKLSLKQSLKPGTMLFPLPVVLVTCQNRQGKVNVLTVAWTGIVCSDPPLVSISVNPQRYSHDFIRETGEFVINLPTAKEAFWTDKCGVVSGRDLDKIERAGFTLGKSEQVSVPHIEECPIQLECRVERTTELGSHTMFIARIVNVMVTRSLIDPKGRVAVEKAGLIAYAHGFYYHLGKQIGRFGFSVRKKKPAGKAPETGRSRPNPPRRRS